MINFGNHSEQLQWYRWLKWK